MTTLTDDSNNNSNIANIENYASSGSSSTLKKRHSTRQTKDTPNSSTKANSKASSKQQRRSSKRLSISFADDENMTKLVLWRRPLTTLYYAARELIYITFHYLFRAIFDYRKTFTMLVTLSLLVTVGFHIEGQHMPVLDYFRRKFLWCVWWLVLGIASSIGLGTGLHTFLLYLGPFIAQVTLAAYECNSLQFPEPPYPDEIICPQGYNSTTESASSTVITVLSIMSKVRLESFMWGAGTAIGELPPYFVARASAASALRGGNGGVEDEELEEFDRLLTLSESEQRQLSLLDRARLLVYKSIKKVGFFGILLCASIPNPLFDLAGITCGHFMVKFWTFFGATLIGKAIIKMHLQKMFVIFLFSQHHLERILDVMSRVPFVGVKLMPLFKEWLAKEKAKLHRGAVNEQSTESLLSWLLGKLVLLMVVFFLVSIVNSLAQQRYKRLVTTTNDVDKVETNNTNKKVAKD